MSFILLGILNSQAAGAGGAGAYDLLETTVLTSSASSVTFTNIDSGYKHLQLRSVARTSRSASVEPINIQFNGDTASNYVKYHRLGGDGSTVQSDTEGDATFIQIFQFPAANAASNVFGAGVTDILDYTSTSKNKTTRTLVGMHDASFDQINLMSGLYESTNAITSLTLTPTTGANLVTGSRFSLYGIKG